MPMPVDSLMLMKCLGGFWPGIMHQGRTVIVVEVRFTDRVERDLTNIGDRIAEDNPAAASAFIAEIRRHCALLDTSPRMGGQGRISALTFARFLMDAISCSTDFAPRS